MIVVLFSSQSTCNLSSIQKPRAFSHSSSNFICGMWDKYFQDTYLFEIMGFEVAVADELLAEALKALPQDRLEIILLSYFADMTDKEIAGHLNLIRRTVAHRRKNALRKLKKIMEGFADE